MKLRYGGQVCNAFPRDCICIYPPLAAEGERDLARVIREQRRIGQIARAPRLPIMPGKIGDEQHGLVTVPERL